MSIFKILPILSRLNSSTPKLAYIKRKLHFSQSKYRQTSQDCCVYPPQPPSGGYKAYKFLFWIAAMPAIIGMSLYNYREYEHKKKCYQRPPFVKYSYLYKRDKNFPWGDGNHTFFHNKEKNALPEGYED
ncbi:cytochrome c oxidase subunit 6A1, mitochondrial-like [Harmonia axyridis]|uniref:cytochrome c oxidase subunit 6A1, mitochondrial-like n=1 Tax=Harmonia axyridis TaxID=115357 RepID=UPI001E278947|nr:cytochrome c oxidase subunit 6A1, mitochondrial-like [Harmonia axyridis]